MLPLQITVLIASLQVMGLVNCELSDSAIIPMVLCIIYLNILGYLDLKYGEVKNEIIAVGTAFSLTTAYKYSENFKYTLIYAIGLTIVFIFMFYKYPESIGGADVKSLFSIIMFLGYEQAIFVIIWSLLLSLAGCFFIKVLNEQEIIKMDYIPYLFFCNVSLVFLFLKLLIVK